MPCFPPSVFVIIGAHTQLTAHAHLQANLRPPLTGWRRSAKEVLRPRKGRQRNRLHSEKNTQAENEKKNLRLVFFFIYKMAC